MAVDLSDLVLIAFLLCCAGAAAVFVWPAVSKHSAHTPEVDNATANQVSTKKSRLSGKDGTANESQTVTGSRQGVLTERQLSLSDSGSNDSGPAAVSPQRRSAGISPVAEWPEARWSKVIDAKLPKNAVAVVLQVISASRRQKQRE